MRRITKEVEEKKKKILTRAMANGVEHGANKMALTAMKLLLGVVFLGWLMIWGMLPTHTYRERWLPMLLSKTKTTYFGRQGTNVLIFTFPIVFIAVVGCVYLHIVQKSDRNKSSSGALKAWRRPLLIKQPLGIVSGTELAFCLMFLAFSVWFFSCYLSNALANFEGERGEKESDGLWLAKLEIAALMLGLLGSLCFAFLFFPVTRASSLLPLVGLTSECSIKYHVWLGHIVMLVFTAHGVCYIIVWAATNRLSELLSLYSHCVCTTGTNILIYTFPILFISVLGCIYLHLVKRTDNSRSSTHRLAAWKRPVVVNWPLGIVSGIELTFCVMFLLLLIWFYTMYLVVYFSNSQHSHSEDTGEKLQLWQTRLDGAGIRLALLGDLCCAFLFFPVIRGSSLLPLVGLTSESSIGYHVWLGHITLAVFSAHSVCYIVYWATTNKIDEMLKWDNTGVANVAGEIAILAGLIMWATTFPRIRRKMFELFFYTHQLYIAFLFFYMLHAGVSHFCVILPGVYLFMVDRYLRFLQSRAKVRLVSARLLPSESIELNFAKSPGLAFEPLSVVFINVPGVSSLQWHPFTVSSSSSLEPERLSVIIKKEGSWTQKLYRTLSSPVPRDRLDVSVEGPYGPVSKNFLRYDSLILVSGGSGITPFISIIRELIYRRTTLNGPAPAVLLICAFKTSADLTMLDLLLPASGNISDLSGLDLRIEAFVTREKSATDDAQNNIQTIWFKPLPSDVPIAPVLGPNGWLWLAAIVSSSFVAFLVLISILQRYYIYPIDHNTNKVFSYSSRSVLNVLFISICIMAAASAAVLWNKRENSKQEKQIQNIDAPTPTTSPGSRFYNADRELESVPRDSLVKATKVHFGGRPPLKKMLLEFDGSNVGVMASGPRGMRHEVATICSSGLADNLHFESISFSW